MKKFVMFMAVFVLLNGCSSMLSKVRFKSTETALLIIDVQNAYLPVYNQSLFIQNINVLIKQAREADVPLIFIRNIDGINKAGSRGWKFQGSMLPQKNDYIIEKHFPSSFSDTDLKDLLDKLDIKNLVLTGLASSGCYGATVTDARLMKYHTVVVKDAHADQVKGRSDNLNVKLANYENVEIIETKNILFF